MIRLERATGALPAGFEALCAEARDEGHSMLDRLSKEWEARDNRFDRDGEVLLAGFVGDVLAGIGGLTIDPNLAGAMRMRRFYVRGRFRRSGVGRALARALLGNAAPGRAVTVNAAAGSEAFWETLGFVPERHEGHTHIRR